MKKHFKLKKFRNIVKRFLKISTSLSLAISALNVFPASQNHISYAADTIKIMPLGDSITYGMADEGGYRKYLDVALKEKNIKRKALDLLLLFISMILLYLGSR